MIQLVKAWWLNALYLSLYAIWLPILLCRRWVHRRPLGHFRQRVLGQAPQLDPQRQCVWLHAVSVGEVNLLEGVHEELHRRFPDCQFVISTTTGTGMQLAQKRFPDIPCFYFPIDFSWAVNRVLRRLSPDLLILAELEVWPNLLGIADQHQIPVAVINGRLSDRSFRGYRKIAPLVQPMFRRLAMVVAQNERYANRFSDLGCANERIHVVGSIKFDGANKTADPHLVSEFSRRLQLDSTRDVLWVAGSTQEPEEAMVAESWQSLRKAYPGLRLAVVPRHPHRGPAICEQLEAVGIASQLRSQWADSTLDSDQVLICDTIGELTALWELADVAFVGGSFGDRGGQNMIEPAAAGTAVCFGPNTWNFRHVVNLMKQSQAAVQVSSEQELSTFIERMVTDPESRRQLAVRGKKLVQSQQGSVSRTVDALQPLLAASATKRAA